jgi:predicted transposase YbfD/YdcC
MNLAKAFLKQFADLEDHRLSQNSLRHNPIDIFLITILATICGADTWAEIHEFAVAKEDWIRTFLSLPSGIPSHDAFKRVFALINPNKFEECFCSWMESLEIDANREFVNIDSKTLSVPKALQHVSSWIEENRVMLGQVKRQEKSNETEAIPNLLNMLDTTNSTIAIDAVGCQKAIAQDILDKGGEYVFRVKENQASLYQDIIDIFALAETRQLKKTLNKCKIEKTHECGQTEKYRYTLISDTDPLMFHVRWPGMKSIGMFEVTKRVNNEVQKSRRFFVTSLDKDMDAFINAVRQDRSTETNLHWSLGVSFREDLNRTRAGHAARNLATVRQIALNFLMQERTHKMGIACKRKTAGWSHKYLMEILKMGCRSNVESLKPFSVYFPWAWKQA